MVVMGVREKWLLLLLILCLGGEVLLKFEKCHTLVTLARLVGLSMLFRAADVASTDRV